MHVNAEMGGSGSGGSTSSPFVVVGVTATSSSLSFPPPPPPPPPPPMHFFSLAPPSAYGSGASASWSLAAATLASRPGDHRAKLAALFKEIEKEFDALYEENQILRHRLGLSENVLMPPYLQSLAHRHTLDNLKKKIKRGLPTQKVSCTWGVLHKFPSHRDGIWEISNCPWDSGVFATASVDRTVRIRNAETGQSMVYYGHKGSVNSIRFRPGERLACTASGDCLCHIIRVPLSFEGKSHARPFPATSSPTPTRRPRPVVIPQHGKSYDEILSQSPLHTVDYVTPSISIASPQQQPIDFDDTEVLPPLQPSYDTIDMVVRSPQQELKGHTNAVIACDFIGENKLISGSWDNTLKLWSITGECLHTTSNLGLDDYTHITNVTSHVSSQLVTVTSSDGFCRLLDIRLPSASASQHPSPCTSIIEAFQAHSDTCTSGVLAADAVSLVTSGFDKSFKVWDLRNTKSPRNTLRGSTAASRFTISPNGRILVPRDEKSATIFDVNSINNTRLAKACTNFPAFSGLVNSIAWAADREESVVYTVSGFDTTVLAWGPDAMFDQPQIPTHTHKHPSGGSL